MSRLLEIVSGLWLVAFALLRPGHGFTSEYGVEALGYNSLGAVFYAMGQLWIYKGVVSSSLVLTAIFSSLALVFALVLRRLQYLDWPVSIEATAVTIIAAGLCVGVYYKIRKRRWTTMPTISAICLWTVIFSLFRYSSGPSLEEISRLASASRSPISQPGLEWVLEPASFLSRPAVEETLQDLNELAVRTESGWWRYWGPGAPKHTPSARPSTSLLRSFWKGIVRANGDTGMLFSKERELIDSEVDLYGFALQKFDQLSVKDNRVISSDAAAEREYYARVSNVLHRAKEYERLAAQATEYQRTHTFIPADPYGPATK